MEGKYHIYKLLISETLLSIHDFNLNVLDTMQSIWQKLFLNLYYVLNIQGFIERKYKHKGFVEHETLKTTIQCYTGLDDFRQEENLLGT